MSKTITISGLNVDKELYALIKDEILPGTGVGLEKFWSGFETTIKELAPKNLACLQKRDALQVQLDDWYRARRNTKFSQKEQKAFLKDIGYLLEEGDDFVIAPLSLIHISEPTRLRRI